VPGIKVDVKDELTPVTPTPLKESPPETMKRASFVEVMWSMQKNKIGVNLLLLDWLCRELEASVHSWPGFVSQCH
jgi:hypothetical protein